MTEASFPKDRVVVGSLCYVFRGDDKNREVLLMRRERPPHKGMWSAPGGKLELSESPDDCVIREIQEETGLTISDPQLRAIVTVYDAEFPIHWLLFVYRANSFIGTLTQMDEGELKWIRLTEIEDYPRPYSDQQHWLHVLNDEPSVWRGKFVYHTPHTLIDEILYL